MKRDLLDTGIASDYVNRRHGVYERARLEVARGNAIGVAVPVWGELWAGIENSSTRDRNAKPLRRSRSEWKVWPFTEEAAEEFGRLFAELARLGRSIGPVDVQIAAVALSLANTIVVSRDRDMTVVPGLTVENWATP